MTTYFDHMMQFDDLPSEARYWIASSESREQCSYPRGCNFDYCVLYMTKYGYELEGKGRYGCVTIVTITDIQADVWKKLGNVDKI